MPSPTSKYETDLELKDLVGTHSLSGVDFDNQEVKDWGDSFVLSQVIRFTLSRKTYVACENPDDGYRSTMRWIRLSEKPCATRFSPVKVVGSMKEGNNTTIEFRHSKTGEVVLEVGTDNQDDYYPWYVASFYPEKLGVLVVKTEPETTYRFEVSVGSGTGEDRTSVEEMGENLVATLKLVYPGATVKALP